MNRRALIALLAVALVAGAGAFIHHRNERLWIGVLLPLTGPDASVGLGMRDSIRLAVEQINARGGANGHKVGVIELDDGSQRAKALEGAKQLSQDPRVLGVISGYDMDCEQSARTVFSTAKLPSIVAGVPVDVFSGGTGQFLILPNPSVQMQQAFDYAWDTLGARRFLYLRSDLLGFAMVGRFNAQASAKNGHWIADNGTLIAPGTTDFAALLENIKKDDPQYILFAGRDPEAAAFLKQLRAAGVSTPVEVQSHYPSQELIDLAGKSAEGALAMFQTLPPQDTGSGKQYLADYQAAGYAEPPGPYGIVAYSAAQAMLTALDKSFLTRASLLGALSREPFNTGLGPFRFIYGGSTYTGAALYQVRDGKWVPIELADAKGKLQPYPAK